MKVFIALISGGGGCCVVVTPVGDLINAWSHSHNVLKLAKNCNLKKSRNEYLFQKKCPSCTYPAIPYCTIFPLLEHCSV